MTKKAGQDENGVANFRAKLNDYLKSKSEKTKFKNCKLFYLNVGYDLGFVKKS